MDRMSGEHQQGNGCLGLMSDVAWQGKAGGSTWFSLRPCRQSYIWPWVLGSHSVQCVRICGAPVGSGGGSGLWPAPWTSAFVEGSLL